MARPVKNNADYFTHDNGMRNDRKLKAVRTRFGAEGYAVYCMLLEVLTEANHLVVRYIDFEIEMLAGDFGIDTQIFKDMVSYFDKLDMIQIKNGWLYSKQLDRRLERVFDKRSQNLESLRRENGVFVPQTRVSASETGVSGSQNPQSKEKKSKEKKEQYAEFVFLVKHEYEKLVRDYGKIDVQRIIDYLDNYKRGHNKRYESDYGVIRTWVINAVLNGMAKKDADVF